MKLKTPILSIFILTLSLFSLFCIIPIQVHADQQQITPDLKWELRTFNFNIFNEWDHESYILDYTGSYDDSFNYSIGHVAYWGLPPQEVWIEENRTVTYQSDYSYYANATYTGNYSMSVSITAYTVEISYGQGSYLLWLAVKNGQFEMEYYIDEISYYREFYNDYYRRLDTLWSVYNMTTGELLTHNLHLDPVEVNDSWSFLDDGAILEGRQMHKITKYNFTLPLILTYQVFTTENDERIAWSDLMDSSFIIFNDSDNNGYYSVGEQNIPDEFSMIESYEFQGLLSPLAAEAFIQLDYQWEGGNSSNTYEYIFPSDKSISDLADSIQFTPPTLSGNETPYTIDWDINYPDYPTDIYLPAKSFYMDGNAPYADTSPANYSYNYKYTLGSEQSDLDLTLDFPKITNTTAYGLVDGSSISLPHYEFFLSSDEISERILNVLTVPSSIFNYEMNGIDIAEVNMEQDKRFYTLYDYPLGDTTTMEAIGSSVTKLVTDSIDEQALLTQKNIFLDLIYTIKDLDLVKKDPKLRNPYEFFTIEMTNYPAWSGERFVHDPTFSTFFTTAPITSSRSISGYNLIAILGICCIVTVVIIKKKIN